MKKLIFFLLLILLLPFINAEIYEKQTNIDMIIPCTINGYPCASTARCNITIIYPNSSFMAENVEMMNRGSGKFNYTLPDSTVSGEYARCVECNQAEYNASNCNTFKINYTGAELSTSQGIVYVVILFITLIIFLLCLYGAVKIPWKNHRDGEGLVYSINDLKYVKMFLWWLLYILGIWTFFLLRTVSEFLYFEAALSFFNLLYMMMLSFLLPSLVVFGIFIAVWIWDDKKIKKMLDRGLRVK